MILNTFYVVPGYTFFYWGFTLKKETYPEFKKYFSLREGNLLTPITLEINRKKYNAKIRITRINNKGKFKNRSDTIFPEREVVQIFYDQERGYLKSTKKACNL